MKCHNCKHNAEIERLAAICSKCKLGDKCAVSNSVSLDNIHDGTLERIAKVAPNFPTAYNFDPGTIDEPPRAPTPAQQTSDALATILACVASLPFDGLAKLAKLGEIFGSLTPQQFEIVAHLLNGGTMIEYAAAHRLSKQTAFARIKTLFKAHPEFKAIANGGLMRGKGGRRATLKVNKQLDFLDCLR